MKSTNSLFYHKVKPTLDKLSSKYRGGLAKLGLILLVKKTAQTTGKQLATSRV